MKVTLWLRLLLLMAAMAIAFASPAWAWRDMNDDVFADFGQGAEDDEFTELSGPASGYANNVCRDGVTFGLISTLPDQIARFGTGEPTNPTWIGRSAFLLAPATTTVQSVDDPTITFTFPYTGSFLVRWDRLVAPGQALTVDGRALTAPAEPTDEEFAKPPESPWAPLIFTEDCLLAPGAPSRVDARRGLLRLVVTFAPGRTGQDLPTTGYLVEVFDRSGRLTGSQEVTGNRAVFGFRVARGAQTVTVAAINDWGEGEAASATVHRRAGA